MQNLLSLQVLRAVAALGVVVCHSAIALNYWAGTDIQWATFASAGVDLFFVVSGFIITLVSWDDFGRLGAVGPFVVRRLVRIGFLYWLLTTVYVAANSYPPERILQSYLLLPSERHLIPIAWTLVLEVMFYGVAALALPLPRIAGLALIGVAICAIWWSGVHFYSSPIIFEFLFGVAIAIAYRMQARIPAFLGIALVVVALAAFALGAPGSLAMPGGLHDPVRWGLPAAAIVAGAVLAPDLPAYRATIAAAAVGDASYALYLTHMPVTHLAGNVARLVPVSFSDSPMAVTCFFVFTAAAAVVLSLLIFRYIESPVLQLTKRLTGPSAKSVPARGRAPSVGGPARRHNAQV